MRLDLVFGREKAIVNSLSSERLSVLLHKHAGKHSPTKSGLKTMCVADIAMADRHGYLGDYSPFLNLSTPAVGQPSRSSAAGLKGTNSIEPKKTRNQVGRLASVSPLHSFTLRIFSICALFPFICCC